MNKGEEVGKSVQQVGCALTLGCLSIAGLVMLVMWLLALARS